ncbi:MAG: hypothetical protein OEW67_11680, partial [Cyclobacteriaceae bacterium]|nr:hypothetical protein [Cyclobacteriaceae bacterium]
MSNYKFIKTLPEKDNFNLFEDLPKKIYKKNSQRFILGHDPVEEHLEGCYVMLENNEPIGRFSFYINPALRYRNQPTGCLGSYEFINNPQASKVLLEYAKQLARDLNFQWLIGSMEGSTWNSYRFSTQNREPNFFMEPYHHTYYNQHFIDGNFKPIAHYLSNLDANLDFDQEQLDRLEQHYSDKGAVFRNINLENLEVDLYKIAQFSIKAFADNFLYTPIEPNNFVDKYMKFQQLFNPELVWIVEDSTGEIQALSFSIKDYNDPTNKTIIIKSLARLPNSNYKGIGGYLAG